MVSDDSKKTITATVISGIFLLIATIISGIFLIQSTRIKEESVSTATAIAQIAQAPLPTYTIPPTFTPLPTYTSLPTYTPLTLDQLQSSSPTYAPFSTQTPYLIIATKVVVSTPVPTVRPTNIPKPTATPLPQPTNTPVPIPSSTPSLVLPFQDNFDRGLRPEWKVISGQPVFADGRLQSAGGELTLEIGDDSLGGNYTVSYYDDVCHPIATVTLGRKVQFYFGYYNWFEWRGFQDNSWVTLPSGAGPTCPGILQIKVAGNSYTVISNGAVILEAVYGIPFYGPVVITLSEGRIIDNFSITSP